MTDYAGECFLRRQRRPAASSSGEFTGGTGIIGFESGIILSSGGVKNVIGPNDDVVDFAIQQPVRRFGPDGARRHPDLRCHHSSVRLCAARGQRSRSSMCSHPMNTTSTSVLSMIRFRVRRQRHQLCHRAGHDLHAGRPINFTINFHTRTSAILYQQRLDQRRINSTRKWTA